MSPRTGRPTFSENEKKDCRLELRLTESELQKIQDCADALGTSKALAILKAIECLSEQMGK